MNDIKPNSHKYKTENSEKKKIEPVVKSGAKLRKKKA